MIRKGSKVTFHYILKVDDEVVDSSAGGDPLSYVHGSDEIVPGLEEGLEGLKAGDKKDVVVSPEKGYGPHDAEAIRKFPKSSFDGNEQPKVGGVVQGDMGGHPFMAKIVEVTDKMITLDLNHPLAGKVLHFSVEIVTVK